MKNPETLWKRLSLLRKTAIEETRKLLSLMDNQIAITLEEMEELDCYVTISHTDKYDCTYHDMFTAVFVDENDKLIYDFDSEGEWQLESANVSTLDIMSVYELLYRWYNKHKSDNK